MSWDTPLVELDVADADVAAVLECLSSGWLTMGPRTQSLEEALAEWTGVKHAILVSSGTAALHLSCRAAGLEAGGEAIVPSMTFVAAAHAPRYCGAETVLCDSRAVLEPHVDPAAVERLIGPRTKAVIAVHMWGCPGPVEELRSICDERGVLLIEDCAEAIGARVLSGAKVGTVGQLGCFSFFSKGQLAVGEGGMITTDDDDLAATVRSLRSHAMSSVTWERHRGHGLGYDVTDFGFNYRIDEPRAALGLSRLARLDADIEARRQVAHVYREGLAGLPGIELPFGAESLERSSYFTFPLLAENAEHRTRLMNGLSDAGVQTTRYLAVHRFGEYAALASDADLPVASELGERQFCLPVNAKLSVDRAKTVVERLAEVSQAQEDLDLSRRTDEHDD